jgi:hypothetical protein
MRTYSQADWTRALREWREGEFATEWREYRHQAAMRGMILPPEGTKWDSWDDDHPSQRAMLIRAIRETPDLMTHAISVSTSWGQVLDVILGKRDEWREELNRPVQRDPEDRAQYRGAMMSIAQILERIDHAR